MPPEMEPIRRPLSELASHGIEWSAELKESRRPLVLTVDERPEFVMQDATTYQLMVDRLRRLDELEAIQAGLDDVAAGRVTPMEEAMEKLRVEFGLQR